MFAFGGCNFGTGASSSSDNSQTSTNTPKTYTVTFQQAGQPDVKKTVSEGDDLTDIPTVYYTKKQNKCQ